MTNEILIRGFTAMVQVWASKPIKAEKLFPFLSPTYHMDLATKIQWTLRQISEAKSGR